MESDTINEIGKMMFVMPALTVFILSGIMILVLFIHGVVQAWEKNKWFVIIPTGICSYISLGFYLATYSNY